MNDIFNENVPLKTETPAFAKHVLPAVPSSEVYLEDCVSALKRFNDNHFDLAIVDPPYGIGEADGRNRTRKKHNNIVKHIKKNWDSDTPSAEYWNELFRVSKNQIVWGANYFTEYLPASMAWVFWEKKIGGDFSDGELAYTSFNRALKMVTIWCETGGGAPKRIHPTQKPVKLYDWLLHNYAKPNDLILDTHLGSGSSRIAAYKGGFNFVGFEIDKEYYEKQEKRFNDFKSQLRLF
jgi:site-specific DNA-methyltransferase (adenine-specific)